MGNDSMQLELRCISSLAKVFADEELNESPYRGASVLANETAAFQVAYRSNRLIKGIQATVETKLDADVSLRSVGLVPSEMPAYHDHDEHVLRTAPGLYPDPLFPLSAAEGLTALPGQWRSVWVTAEPGAAAEAGLFELKIRFASEHGETLGEETFELELLPFSLPEQRLVHTEWFHTDCLATYYKTEVFSERHWAIIERFIGTAVRHGINMILTPIFTPPLDTQIGGERPTVQLVDVTRTADASYRFGFDKLARWVELCDRQGVRYFEFSHLFTQWGAKHAPKIMAAVDGAETRIFGWETDAGGDEYRSFIHQLLPALTAWIKANGLEARSYFHVSDEPSLQHLESYKTASEMVGGLLQDFPVIDALSDYDFYAKGLVKNPIPANDHIGPFLDNGVENLWTYYCCGQYKQVANRFFCMPSARSRILGIQLYKFNLAGFLQWGYKFWYSQQSRHEIDPYRVTDAIHAFPSGDAFLVYPGANGQPVESIRLEVLREALQDLRALQLLEAEYGRAYVLAGLEEGLAEPISFSRYPREAEWLLAKREWVNAKLKAKRAQPQA